LKLLPLSTEAISHVVLERDKWRLDIEHTTFLVLLLASIASPDISVESRRSLNWDIGFLG
jgi:hypothetical protein